jgi:hypothetical protein
MRTSRAAVYMAAGFALSLAGCVIIDDHDHAGFDSAVGEAQMEVAVHHAALDATTSMTAARGEIDRHRAAIASDFEHIRVHLRDVDWSCDWMGPVWSALDAASARTDAYMDDAGGATTLDGVKATGHDYALDQSHLLDQLRDRFDETDCWW